MFGSDIIKKGIYSTKLSMQFLIFRLLPNKYCFTMILNLQ